MAQPYIQKRTEQRKNSLSFPPGTVEQHKRWLFSCYALQKTLTACVMQCKIWKKLMLFVRHSTCKAIKCLFFLEDIELSWILAGHLKARKRKVYQCTGNTSRYLFSESMAHDEPREPGLHSFILSSELSSRVGLYHVESRGADDTHPICVASGLSKSSRTSGTPFQRVCFGCHSEVTHGMAGVHCPLRSQAVVCKQ